MTAEPRAEEFPGPALRAEALESLLLEKGLIDPKVVDGVINRYVNDVGPMNGAKVVARAWVDAGYRERLLADGTAAAAELGIAGIEGDDVRVVENTERVHNLVVCTLCSCYPWPLLGIPPIWYKSFAYRARAVAEPRAVLGEFGCVLDDDVEVRVWDSSAAVRYLVLPARPVGTEHLDEDQLATLVTRNAMIGVEMATAPPP